MNAPLVTIAIPVFNMEKTIRVTIESVLNQSFKNFVLIISDNQSTDSTAEICSEYMNRDSRIILYKQRKLLTAVENFEFTLNICDTKYFVWIAGDDFWSDTFLEETITILENNNKTIGALTECIVFSEKWNFNSTDKLKINDKETDYVIIEKSLTDSIVGNFSDKSRKFFSDLPNAIYGVYITSVLKKVLATTKPPPRNHWDLGIVIGLLEIGDIHITPKYLMYRYKKKVNRIKSIRRFIDKNERYFLIKLLWRILFPSLDFTLWFISRFGWRMFFFNWRFFAKRNLDGPIGLLITIKNIFTDYKNLLK